MSDSTIIAIITAIPPTLMSLAAFIQSIRNGRAVTEVHTLVNSAAAALAEEKRLFADQVEAERKLSDTLIADLERQLTVLLAATTAANPVETPVPVRDLSS